MSTPKPQPDTPPAAAIPAAAQAPAKPAVPQKREVLIVSHCTLFYWWPVWVIGFLMFLITAFTGEYMVTLPTHTTIKEPREVKAAKKGEQDTLIYEFELPAKHKLPMDNAHPGQPRQPHLWMSSNKNLGVLFVIVLLLVITITNVPLRGLWSAFVIGSIVTFSILFAWLEWWDSILNWIGILDIRINAAGYLVVSAVLLVLWLLVVLLFDRQIYVVLTPKQLRVRKEIGGAEDIYDTTNMKVQKQRNDFFRHWVLGFGSGDLIVKPNNSEEIHMPNVLFIGYKVKKIEEMLEIQQVEAAGAPAK